MVILLFLSQRKQHSNKTRANQIIAQGQVSDKERLKLPVIITDGKLETLLDQTKGFNR